jgi:protein-disulfide isomerase
VPAFRKMHDLLYANQPAEGGDGPEDPELLERAEQAGVGGTPTVLVAGQEVQNAAGGPPGIAELQAAIAAAAA